MTTWGGKKCRYVLHARMGLYAPFSSDQYNASHKTCSHGTSLFPSFLFTLSLALMSRTVTISARPSLVRYNHHSKKILRKSKVIHVKNRI